MKYSKEELKSIGIYKITNIETNQYYIGVRSHKEPIIDKYMGSSSIWTKNWIKNNKDILIKGNKIYSPQTCCFVPHQINNLNLKSNTFKSKNPPGVTEKNGKFLANIFINKQRIFFN
jgi:hypothetical protein